MYKRQLYHYNEADNRLAPSFTVNFKDNPILHDYIELPDYYLICLLYTSCSRHYRSYPLFMEQAQSCVETAPDSALHYLSLLKDLSLIHISI